MGKGMWERRKKTRIAVGEDVPVCSATCGGGLLPPAGTVLLSADSPSNTTREEAAQSQANMPKQRGSSASGAGSSKHDVGSRHAT